MTATLKPILTEGGDLTVAECPTCFEQHIWRHSAPETCTHCGEVFLMPSDVYNASVQDRDGSMRGMRRRSCPRRRVVIHPGQPAPCTAPSDAHEASGAAAHELSGWPARVPSRHPEGQQE